MGILSDLELRATSQQLGPPRDPVIAAWFGGNSSATGLAVNPDTAMRVTAVFRAVLIRAQTFASLPLGVFREDAEGSKVLDKKHPNYRLLHDQPNRWQTSFEWREMMEGHLSLRGNGYSEIVSTGGQAIAELVPLHPDRVRPFWAPDRRVAYEYTPLDGPSRVILQSEMHHLRGFPAADGLRGMNPIEMCREAIGVALATEEHGARLFSNGTRLGGVLKMTGHLKDDEARKKFLKSWREAHAGVRNAHKTALLEDGMEWQSIGLNSVDAQFLETRKMQIAEIARIFGVPLHMLAELDRSTNNNIEHQGMEFVTHTVRPEAVRWEQAMKRDLFYGASKETHCAEFNLDGLMRGDSGARGGFYSTMLQNGVFNRNEVRRLENRNPSDAPGMNDYTVQSNMALIQLLDTLSKLNKPGASDGKNP
jgi:HK97 family phage portal protein